MFVLTVLYCAAKLIRLASRSWSLIRDQRHLAQTVHVENATKHKNIAGIRHAML